MRQWFQTIHVSISIGLCSESFVFRLGNRGLEFSCKKVCKGTIQPLQADPAITYVTCYSFV